MLSYRHAFHAGNHADVLKHLCLYLVLRYYNRKDKPYWYIDTHAGAGCYSINSTYAQKTGEYEQGFARLLTSEKPLVSPLNDFVQTIQTITHNQEAYLGSPLIAAHLLREKDKIRLFEKHTTDFPLLNQACQSYRHKTIIKQEDGFQGLISLLPPPTRRAVTLIDPSYETEDDYHQVSGTLKKALKRFANGCYMVWYPILNKERSQQLPEQLKKIAPHYLNAVLQVKGHSGNGFGMNASGMFIINPPYLLAEELQQVLPQLVEILRQDQHASYSLQNQTE